MQLVSYSYIITYLFIFLILFKYQRSRFGNTYRIYFSIVQSAPISWPSVLFWYKTPKGVGFFWKKQLLIQAFFILVNHESRSQSSIFELRNLCRQPNQTEFDRILWFEDDTGTFIISLGDPPDLVNVRTFYSNLF